MIQAGIAGFKCFLIHSGVDEFPHVTEQDLHEAMKQLQGTNSVLLVRGANKSVLESWTFFNLQCRSLIYGVPIFDIFIPCLYM